MIKGFLSVRERGASGERAHAAVEGSEQCLDVG
jgi:hypothetical protein